MQANVVCAVVDARVAMCLSLFYIKPVFAGPDRTKGRIVMYIICCSSVIPFVVYYHRRVDRLGIAEDG